MEDYSQMPMPAVTANPPISQMAPAPIVAEEAPEFDIKSGLEGLGKSYNTGGYSAMMDFVKQNPQIAQALKSKPIARQIVSNPNPKNQNPDHMAINGLMGAMDTTKLLAQAQQQTGVNMADPNVPPEQKKGLWDRLTSGIQDARAKPGTPAYDANQAYWGALIGGGGYAAATSAYVDVYKAQVTQQNSIALEAAKKQIDFNIKNQDRIALTKGATDGIGRTLAGEGSNIPVQTIQQIQEQASNILSSAKNDPAAAAGAARALVQQLSEMGVPEKQLTGVARLLGDVVKLDPNKQKEYDALDKTALSGSGALTRYQFGIATESDNKKISAAIDEIKAKEAARAAREEAEKQTAVALAKAQAAITPTASGKTPQEIEAQGKVAEAIALIPTKVDEQTALIPGKVQEQKELMPGKVQEAGKTAGATAAAQLPYQKKLEEYKTGQEGQRVFSREAAQEVVKRLAAGSDTASSLSKYNKAIAAIDSGQVSIGPITSTQPLQQWFGKNMPNPTKASQNTKDVADAIQTLAAQATKAFDSRPTDQDLKFITENKPDVAKDSPERIRAWLDSAAKKLATDATMTGELTKAAGITTSPGLPKPVTPSVTPIQVEPTTKVVNGVTYVHDGKGWKKQ